MKKLLASISFFFVSFLAGAQSEDIPELALGFTQPEVKGFTDDQNTLLRTKALETLSAAQVGVYDYQLNFYLQPEFAVVNKKVSEGGLRKIYLVNAKFILSVKNVTNGQVLSATSVAIQGSGLSEEEAVSNALNAIEADASSIQDFLATTKEKVGQYYQSQCSVLSRELEVLLTQKKYETALVRLGTIPSQNTACLDKLKPVRARALKGYEQQAKAKATPVKKAQPAKTAAGADKAMGSNANSQAIPVSNNRNTNAQNAFSNISVGSEGSVGGSNDPVRAIAAAILSTKQMR